LFTFNNGNFFLYNFDYYIFDYKNVER
jgi:hypothetical protein